MNRTTRRPIALAAVVVCTAALISRPAAAEVFDVRQGTNLSLAANPDGDELVIDLLGGLWRLPVTGGGAQLLIPAGSGIAQPRIDAAGERVVFQRWIDEQWDVWELTLADGRYRALTETPYNEREPDYSPDGSRIVFSSDRTGSYQIWSLDLANSSVQQLTNQAGDSRFPSYSSTGELAYATRTGLNSVLHLHLPTGRSNPLISTTSRRLSAPSWRPGGGVMIYSDRVDGEASDLGLFIEADEPIRRRLTGSEDVFVGRVAWLSPAEYVYAADGQLWRRRIGSTEREQIQLIAGASVDAEPPAPVSRPLDAIGPHPVAGINGLVRHAPSRRVAFSALGDLWLVDDGVLTQLTNDPWIDAWPDFLPDGSALVFASDRRGVMDIWRVDLDDRGLSPLSSGSGRSFMPRVSADGRYVIFLETQADGPWDAAALKLLALDTGTEASTLATGLYDARDLSWQGRFVRLLARDQNVRESLRRVYETDAEDLVGPGPEDRAVPMPSVSELPVWQPAGADEPYVIQAGRVFDGIGTSYNYFVDIHVEGQRITNIVRRGQLPLPDKIINAEDSTVLPGLIDVHAHHSSVSGNSLGSSWLRNGVTTVREAMAITREAIERAETWDSGRIAGPRLVISSASPPVNLVLPSRSPIVLGGSGVARSLSHDLAEQLQRADEPLSQAPPVLATGTIRNEPVFAVSPLGRSYQDIIGQLTASGTWLPSSLGALEAAAALPGADSLTATIDGLIRSTGRVAIGSDAPAVAYGVGFHRELELLAEHDVPNDQILRWATAGGALALGLSLQTGTLEAGKLADFVVIDGDPLQDIRELRQIEAVVRGGIWYAVDGEDLRTF